MKPKSGSDLSSSNTVSSEQIPVSDSHLGLFSRIGIAWVFLILLSCQTLSPARIAEPAFTPPPTLVQPPTSTVPASPTETEPSFEVPHLTAVPTKGVVQIEEYVSPAEGVTVHMPQDARYIVIGDSLSYGSTLSGATTYSDICENRWPFTQQLAVETGILATSTLDRGDSMKTPFFSQQVRGRTESYCVPPADDPLSSTAVPGSTTAEWLAEHLENPVLLASLGAPENRVVLLALGADVYADRIGKPAVNAVQYGLNIGAIIERLIQWEKVIYLAQMPHVRSGSFIRASEVGAVNAQIDQFNLQLVAMVEDNGYSRPDGSWVDFGTVVLTQDNRTVWFTRLQAGPDLSSIPPDELNPFIAKDGLHFHAPGYDRIGSAWADALQAPARAEKYVID